MRFRHPFFPLLPLTVISLLAAIIIPTCARYTETTAPTPATTSSEPGK